MAETIVSYPNFSAFAKKKIVKTAKKVDKKSKKPTNKKPKKAVSKQKPQKSDNKIKSIQKSPQKQLNDLNQEIKDTKKKISGLNKQEQSTLNKLETTQKQITSVNRYLNVIEEELNSLQDSINYLTRILNLAGVTLGSMKTSYSQIASDYYINSKLKPKNLLSGLKNEDKLKNDLYMSILTENSANGVDEISNFMDSTEKLVNILNQKTSRQKDLKNIKEREKKKLGVTISSNQKLLKKIRGDKNLLLKELKQKEQSAKTLKNIIANLAKQEKEKEKAKQKKSTSSASKESTTIVYSGKLNWPTTSRRILHGYGEYRNSTTNTVFDNPGIDIAVGSGSPVYASSNGVVSLIHWLPGYGSLIIINHGNDTRTVYANLSSVNVRKDQRVKGGQTIGASGESVDGEFLHFEVWKGNRRINPLNYFK